MQATEEELAATRCVVEEQSCTERALRAEAEQTKASLASAEGDIGDLRGKVARQASFYLLHHGYFAYTCILRSIRMLIFRDTAGELLFVLTMYTLRTYVNI